MFLDPDVFQLVVASTPLVSIDLVVENGRGEVLLGLRNNRPAQGCWFVPGGRIYKNETLDAAFTRITMAELGLEMRRRQGAFLDLYEHIYTDSVFGDSPSTHYVVLAYRLHLPGLHELPLEQHADHRWWRIEDAIDAPAVHGYTRLYLEKMVRGRKD